MSKAKRTSKPKSKSTPMDEYTPEMARSILAMEEKARLEACNKEIDAALQKHGCELQALMVLTPGNVEGRVNLAIKK